MPAPRTRSIAALTAGALAAMASLLLTPAMGCSLLVSYDGLVGDGGVGGGGGGGAPPACDPSNCVATAPTGWAGPVAFFSGSSDATLPKCDGVSLDLGAGKLDAPPAMCTACACDPPTGQTCGNGVLTAYAGANCSGGSSDSTEMAGGGCQGLVSMTGNDWFSSKPVPSTGGSCKASGGKMTRPPTHFEEQVRLCASNGVGCDNGDTCFPTPPPAYDAKPCIYRMGDFACDVSGFPTKHSAHAGVDDSRACDPCTCGPASTGTCPAETQLFDLDGCVTLLNTAHHDNMCVDAGGTQSWMFTITGPPQDATCTPSPGGPIGAATPGSTFTICCAG